MKEGIDYFERYDVNEVKGACDGCPFVYSNESEMIQNYGCLPTHNDIVKSYKNDEGHWKCHSANKRCAGLCHTKKKYQIQSNNEDLLVTEDNPLEIMEKE